MKNSVPHPDHSDQMNLTDDLCEKKEEKIRKEIICS